MAARLRDGRVRFGFVHGNCALDNSTTPDHCGVTRELDALRKAGCYADFTLPSLGSPAQPSKVNSIYWVAARVCVKGRQDWIFVKVHTHGAQSRTTCLGPETDAMFGRLERRYGRGGYRLHYVTAREAYNIVRAAEDGLTGDPDNFRDYEVTQPRNKHQ